MTAYYQARAREYEAIYDKPERQADLAALKSWLANAARGRAILEIACGTGYWTAVAAATAQVIHATDFNSSPLDIARAKHLGAHVTFGKADAYALPDVDAMFDCGMAHFWWSHVARADEQGFLTHLASKLAHGARLLMIDNRFVAGSSTPIARTDADGNTYQLRKLSNGSTHAVLKNFPTSADLRAALAPVAKKVEVVEFTYFWALAAELK